MSIREDIWERIMDMTVEEFVSKQRRGNLHLIEDLIEDTIGNELSSLADDHPLGGDGPDD